MFEQRLKRGRATCESLEKNNGEDSKCKGPEAGALMFRAQVDPGGSHRLSGGCFAGAFGDVSCEALRKVDFILDPSEEALTLIGREGSL